MNRPISSQGYINNILFKKPNIFNIVYLNNIFIYIETQAIHRLMRFNGFLKN